MTQLQTLGKKERVKSRKITDQLFAAGKKMMVPPFRIHYLFAATDHKLPASLQFGVGVSTRNFKKAVDRNRVKRLTREAWRLQKNELAALLATGQKQLAVFFIYTGRELPSFKLVKEKTAVALAKLVRITGETSAANT